MLVEPRVDRRPGPSPSAAARSSRWSRTRPAEHPLAGERAARAPRAGVDHQVRGRSGHRSPPCGMAPRRLGRSSIAPPEVTVGPAHHRNRRKNASCRAGPAARPDRQRAPRRERPGRAGQRPRRAPARTSPRRAARRVQQPGREPGQVRGEPPAAQVLPGEDQACSARPGGRSPSRPKAGPNEPKPAVIGHRLGHVIPLPAGHPAAEAEVEVLDPAGEVERVVAAERQELRAGRRPGPARPRPSGRAGRRRPRGPARGTSPGPGRTGVRTRVRIPSYVAAVEASSRAGPRRGRRRGRRTPRASGPTASGVELHVVVQQEHDRLVQPRRARALNEARPRFGSRMTPTPGQSRGQVLERAVGRAVVDDRDRAGDRRPRAPPRRPRAGTRPAARGRCS